MEYEVCYCGYHLENHNFRHCYDGCIDVRRDGNKFYMDANNFPENFMEKCNVDQCTLPSNLHNVPKMDHKYSGKKISYKNIQFVLPDDTKCSCGKNFEEHKSELTHLFTVMISIKNKKEVDKVTLIHPEDDDIKIKVDEF